MEVLRCEGARVLAQVARGGGGVSILGATQTHGDTALGHQLWRLDQMEPRGASSLSPLVPSQSCSCGAGRDRAVPSLPPPKLGGCGQGLTGCGYPSPVPPTPPPHRQRDGGVGASSASRVSRARSAVGFSRTRQSLVKAEAEAISPTGGSGLRPTAAP